MKWQKRARFAIAVFAVAFAVVVVLAFKHRPAAAPVVSTPAPDPNAVVVSTGGDVARYTGTRKDVAIEYDKQLTYADGSTKLLGVRVVTVDRGNRRRSFRVEAKEGQVGQNQSTLTMTGDVRLTASDGLVARAEHATYADSDATVRAPGPVSFSRGRLSGSGVGMTYDKNRDVLTIARDAVVHMAPDARGAGAAAVTAATATIARREKLLRFEGNVHIERGGQVIEAAQAIAHLSEDEKRLEAVELHGDSHIAGTTGGGGALRDLTGRDMNLQYAADGQTLRHAAISGGAAMVLAGAAGKAGRRIEARTIDVTFAPDGTTPVALIGRDNVVLTFPADAGSATRTIRAATLDSRGEARRGLTGARFTGNVQYRERGGTSDSAANSGALDVSLEPGFGAIQEATFTRGLTFRQGTMTAEAASGEYRIAKGTLELTRADPNAPTPHVANDQIVVDAPHINVTLSGPELVATGPVKSVLRPTSGDAKNGGRRMPAMLKRDQPVNVTADALTYDGHVSKATYTGAAQLWQGDTSVRADSLVLDGRTGDLTGDGAIATSISLEQTDPKTKARERTRSLATARSFHYEDAPRRATYTTDAHVTGPQGDLTATKVELYLLPSGDELERAEAYEKVTIHESGRTVTGDRLTYFGADERYVVTGTPVHIVDECERETIGRTLTFFRATDTILVDGNQQIRTQTKGGGKCSGS
ncbi:MAG: LPS export ABC transporter periplasmic protein LptC [Betaproteobacteria bacterium]